MKNQITPRSPKNKFRIEISLDQANELGSEFSFGSMDVSDVENDPMFQHYAEMGPGTVRILENKSTFPIFDWTKVKEFNV